MAHRQHSSWKTSTRSTKGGDATASRLRAQQAVAQQALAEGMQRPAPGLTPPLTYDEHFDAKVEQIKAAEGEE